MSNSNAPKKKGLSTRAVVLIVVLAVLISGTVLAVAMIMRPSATIIEIQPTPMSQGGVQIITGENVVEIEQSVRESVARGMFRTYMNTTWSFPDGRSASTNAVMGNSSSNNYPFWFEVMLSGTNEVVLTSGLLPVGTQMAEIKLDTPLAKGEYPAVVQIHMIDEDNETVESNMGFAITLIIVN